MIEAVALSDTGLALVFLCVCFVVILMYFVSVASTVPSDVKPADTADVPAAVPASLPAPPLTGPALLQELSSQWGHWFDFNDSSVTPMTVPALSKAFAGMCALCNPVSGYQGSFCVLELMSLPVVIDVVLSIFLIDAMCCLQVLNVAIW